MRKMQMFSGRALQRQRCGCSGPGTHAGAWFGGTTSGLGVLSLCADPVMPAGSELLVCTMQHLSCSMHSCRTYEAPLPRKISVLQPCLHHIRMTRPSHACACTCRHDSTITPLMVSMKEKGEQRNKGSNAAPCVRAVKVSFYGCKLRKSVSTMLAACAEWQAGAFTRVCFSAQAIAC